MLNLLCLCSVNGTTKPEWQHICVQHHLLITPSVETYCSEKQRFLSNYDYSLTMHQELWWRCMRLMLFSCLLMQNPFCSPCIKGSFQFKKYISQVYNCHREWFLWWVWEKSIENLWKGFTILGAIKNVGDSWEEVKISIWTGVWKKWTSTLLDDFEVGRGLQWGKWQQMWGNSKRIRSGAWRWDWISVTSW